MSSDLKYNSFDSSCNNSFGSGCNNSFDNGYNNGFDYDKERKKIFSKTKKNMIALGTYRAEFDVIVQRYAEMRIQSDMLHKRWYNEGCVITEEYTNNDGATNERKTALYMAIEKLRSELTKMETLFGMTPKGLKDIRKKGLEQKKESALDKMLGG